MSDVNTTKTGPIPISKQLKPTIVIFFEVEIVDGVKGFPLPISRRDKILSVDKNLSILWSLLTIHSHLYLCPYVGLKTVLPYNLPNTLLLLHFIITVTSLAVVPHSFFRFLKPNQTAGSLLPILGKWSELDRTRPTSLAAHSYSTCLH